MDRLVKLSTILQEQYLAQEGDCIQLSVVWSSGKPKDKNNQNIIRYIFADLEGNHIGGILFLNGGKNPHAHNVSLKLKKKKACMWKFKNFTIEEVLEDNRILRNQSKQIVLSASTENMEEITGQDNNPPFCKHNSFKFTELEEIDKCAKETIIDVVGYVKDISKVLTSKEKGIKYCILTICSYRSHDPEKIGFLREIALFGESLLKKPPKGSVCAILNIKVGKWERRKGHKNKSLQTIRNTMIVMLTESNIELLPLEYREDEAILKLFPRKRTRNSLRGKTLSNLQAEQHFYLPNVKRQRLTSVDDFPKKIYNFEGNVEPLNVLQNTKTSTVFMDQRDDNAYRMQSNPRGIALIINNYLFPENDSSNVVNKRHGADKDTKNLQEIFKIFKFDVTIKENVLAQQLTDSLQDFKETAKPEMDACIVAILSHGAQGLVQMVDGELVRTPNDIIHQFDKNAFPEFAKQPKIFIFQTCSDVPDEFIASKIKVAAPEREISLELENIIECHAAAPGTVARRGRNENIGSHFIYILVDTLMEHSHDTDLLTILQLVQIRMQNVRLEDSENFKQNCTWLPHQFNKKLYFNPGL